MSPVMFSAPWNGSYIDAEFDKSLMNSKLPVARVSFGTDPPQEELAGKPDRAKEPMWVEMERVEYAKWTKRGAIQRTPDTSDSD